VRPEAAKGSPSVRRIAISGLDTSHPDAFVPLLRALGWTVTAVHDGGTVRPRGYALDFARRHGIPSVAASVDELCDDVDVVLVSGCDWEAKFPAAERVLGAGVDVFLDKPAVASVSELMRLRETMRPGQRISGGSALLWDSAAAQERAAGGIDGVVVDVAGHPYDYGVHAVALAVGLLGPGLNAVRADRCDERLSGELLWADGRSARIEVGPDEPPGYRATVRRGPHRHAVVPRIDTVYEQLLRGVMPFLDGTASGDDRLAEVFRPEQACLALRASASNGGGTVTLDDAVALATRWPSGAFVSRYRAERSGQ
jgi:hypothetical protein